MMPSGPLTGRPGQAQIVTPPVRKTVIACCGYTCLQGMPAPWECPGCGRLHLPKPP